MIDLDKTMKFIGIGLSGKICSGKSLLAKMLTQKYTGFIASLADEVKAVTNYLFGEIKRELLQGVGTMLRNVDEDVWINKLLTNVKALDAHVEHERIRDSLGEHPLLVVDDVRFQNEKMILEENGWIVIRINVLEDNQRLRSKDRDDIELTDDVLNHPSETDLDNTTFTHCIDGNKDINSCFDDIVKIIDGVINGNKRLETSKNQKRI